MADGVVPASVLDRLRARLAARAGLEPPDWVLASRLRERMLAVSAASAESYADLVCAPRGADELALLIDAVRVGETRFFRHRQQVDALIELVVPAVRARGGGAVRAWSAGCASGEEAYTMAMVLDRHLPPPGWSVTVWATDVSAEAVEHARRGRYPGAALQHVPDDWRAGFVTDADGAVRPSDEIAALVELARHNLADEPYPVDLDVIWCRNVLIYFTAEARRRVLGRLIESLRPGGHLFVGYSESVRDIAGVEAVRTGDAVVYRRLSDDADRRRAATPALGLTAIARAATPAGGVPVRSSPALTRTTAPTPAVAPPTADLPRPDEPGADEARRVALRGRYDEAATLAALAAELGAALTDHRRVVIDLDGAELLDDDAAPVLRRAVAAGRGAGVRVELVATRAGTQRWLRRHRLDEEPPP